MAHPDLAVTAAKILQNPKAMAKWKNSAVKEVSPLSDQGTFVALSYPYS